MARSDGDHLKDKTASESEFQKSFTPATAPSAPVKLGAKEYDADLWDSPTVRTLKRALTGWDVPGPPARPAPLSRVLEAGDPQLVATATRPGRDAWRANLVQLLVSAGAAHLKPTACFLAGPLGAAQLALTQRMFEQGVLSREVVRADADYLHGLIPEASALEALGDSRFVEVVHDEASQLAKTAFALALTQKRDVVHSSMFGDADAVARLAAAKSTHKRLVFAVASGSLELARARAGGGGVAFDDQLLVSAHAAFARGFDALVKGADELVLLQNDGVRLHVIAQGKAGELTVLDQARYTQFRAMKDSA